MKTELIAIDDLIPYARNARTHSDQQVAQIAASIREFGFCNPVLIDSKEGIIAGHGRVMAARKLGIIEIPCIRLDHLSDTQRRAYIIADNKLALNAGWDMELLALEFDDLKGMDFDLELTGFDDAELAGMDLAGETKTEGDTEPQVDRAEELREKWGVEPGDLWALGEHRLLCGDSTKAEDVARVMGGEKADLCFTSPPYGQQRDYRDGATEKVSDWDSLMQGVFGNLPMSDAGQVLVNLGLIHRDNEWIPYWDGWIQWMRQQGWRRFGWYVWDQGDGFPGDWAGRFAPSHEFVFHFNKESVKPEKIIDCRTAGQNRHKKEGEGTVRKKDGSLSEWCHSGQTTQDKRIGDSVLRVYRHKARGIEKNHPAVFPVELSELIIKSWPGIIYEPFSGSGTTIIACTNLKRKCRAIEISPVYTAVCLERFFQHTGITPTRHA
jgi:DNA modification methylase